MKILKTAVLALFLTAAFASCKKDNDQPKSNPAIEGVYSGKFGYDNDVPDQNFKFAVKPNGIFQELSVNSGNPTGQGTYTLNGNNLKANYKMLFSPYSEYSVNGTFNPSTGKMTGTWGYDKNASDGGKIDMSKQE